MDLYNKNKEKRMQVIDNVDYLVTNENVLLYYSSMIFSIIIPNISKYKTIIPII